MPNELETIVNFENFTKGLCWQDCVDAVFKVGEYIDKLRNIIKEQREQIEQDRELHASENNSNKRKIAQLEAEICRLKGDV